MDEKRLIVALFGVFVATVSAYIAYRFIAALTVAVFLYYSTRRFYTNLGRARIPARIRAVIVLSFIAIPLLLLISYTLVLLVLEVREFVVANPAIESTTNSIVYLESLDDIPPFTIDGIVQAYQSGDFDPFLDFAIENAAVLTSTVTGFFLNLFVATIVTYYLLLDGSRVHDWLLKFDDDAIIREYLVAVDEELEAVLFGNLLNVIVISLVAVVTFMGYNALVPQPAEVPYPALAGALTGIASLIPVVGMKIVYIPLAGIASVPIVLSGEVSLFVYILGFLIITLVIVDTIPDVFLRPFLSGKRTHVGLLMLAYVFGPIVFGFYGIFLAPIILVLALVFAQTALPRLLGVEPVKTIPTDQRRLSEFSQSLALDDDD
ncbi:MAG: AI-2E family transporter [Natronomonas sp.]